MKLCIVNVHFTIIMTVFIGIIHIASFFSWFSLSIPLFRILFDFIRNVLHLLTTQLRRLNKKKYK